jgi:uncharacterized protein (TIGR03118 family)
MRELTLRRATLVFVALAAAIMLVGRAAAADTNTYTVHNLVSDGNVPADFTDANLVNAWGLVASSTSPWWVADNGTGLSTLYNGAGVKQGLEVTVDNDPTGAVFNGNGAAFDVSQGGKSGAARFIFAGEAGTILGWSPSVAATTAVLGADRSGVGAVYKGLAILNNHLYATDFKNARVDVFDSSFGLATAPGAFVDPMIPDGWAPFGIQALNGKLFVTYAKQGEGNDELHGQGLGFVDEYSADGALLARVARHGQLNAPWGLAVAPNTGFGAFSGDLLVGNFGDGRINAYEPQPDGTFELIGPLRGADGQRIVIDGLWALEFGNGVNAGPTDSLFFTAGPNDEADGLFGVIRAG